MLQGLFLCILETGQGRRGGVGGGGVLSYISHIGMSRTKEYMAFAPCRSENGYRIAHFGLESGMVFERATGGLNVLVVSIPNE